MDYVFPPAPAVSLPVLSGKRFPVNRVFCIGQNYAAHVREMGGDPAKTAPVFFMKPASAVIPNGSTLPYPPATRNLQPEVELVVALQRGGRDIPAELVEQEYVFGYAVGLDMTRRDLQWAAKDKGEPWDMAKAFDGSAPCSAITPLQQSGIISRGRIALRVNGEVRQDSDVSDMILHVPQIVHQLSTLVELQVGDLIFTGTPAGVAPVLSGDRLEATVAELETLTITLG